MVNYVTLPGFQALKIVTPETATVEQFVQKLFENTGVSTFTGMGYTTGAGQNLTVPTASDITNASVYDFTQNAAKSFADVPYSALLSTIFNDGDAILFYNMPIG